jgi:hypothetical protein
MGLCNSVQKKRIINKMNDNLKFSASVSVYSEGYIMLVVYAGGGGGGGGGKKERG